MAKVMNAIRMRENAPLAEYIKTEAARCGWTLNQLTERAFGRNEMGKIKNSGYIYGIVKGKNRPQLSTLGHIARALEVPLETMLALLPPEPGTPAVTTPKAVSVAQPVSPPRPDQFALTINGAGQATLRLHLVDLSPDKALRVMAALTSAGLLPTGIEETNP